MGTKKCPHHQVPFFTLLDPTPRPVPPRGAPGLGCSPAGRGEAFRPRLPAASLPRPGREETQEAAPGSRGVEGLGRASQPSGLRPRPARGGAQGSGRRAGRRLTHLGCQSFQLRGYLVPPPPLLSRDPGALRLITFPDTTWPSAAARRSASRRPNRPPPTLRSGPGLRREPRRRRRRAGEADGRSGFRLGPQRRTRRRERRGEGEAEEGEATSLPGPYAAHDAGAQRAEDSEEEAVATAPHAHTATASPPPGSARRAAARHAGSGGGAGARRAKAQGRGRTQGRGRWAWSAVRPLALDARHHAPRAARRSGPRRGGSWERGIFAPPLHAHPPIPPRKAPDPRGLGGQV